MLTQQYRATLERRSAIIAALGTSMLNDNHCAPEVRANQALNIRIDQSDRL